jgi:hypothetical protein
MAQEASAKSKDTYKGICNFCHEEFDKAKMTRHLQSCKERKAQIAAEAQTTKARQPAAQRLFHLIVEGDYLPMYWMHLEMPASETLYGLDDFLRAVWVECCDHLSAFQIGKMSYLSQTEEDMFDMFGDAAVDEEEDDEGDDEDEADEELEEELGNLADMPMDKLFEELNQMLTTEFQTDPASLSPEEFNERFFHLLERKLQEETGESGTLSPEMREQLEMVLPLMRSMLLNPSLAEAFEPRERDMDVALSEVLKDGDKFKYEYDFGSTTELRLRVVGAREGYRRKKDEAITILARNNAPIIPCRQCGQPATKIEPGYISALTGALCDRCASKVEDVEWFLPVVNSPRVGVCAYTGG